MKVVEMKWKFRREKELLKKKLKNKFGEKILELKRCYEEKIQSFKGEKLKKRGKALSAHFYFGVFFRRCLKKKLEKLRKGMEHI